MPRVPYDWRSGSPPEIKAHSIAKLDVLRAYLLLYFRTLIAPNQDELRVTLVDGFSGGGLYRHEDTKQHVLGSPFVFLDAAKEAEALINQSRQKAFRLNASYFFVDEDENAVRTLAENLTDRNYGHRIGHDVTLVQGRFETVVDQIRTSVLKRTPRSGRALFFLDQYGYGEVPTPLIQRIFLELPAAEIILTFNVDAFINFASDSATTAKTLSDIGIPDVLRGRTIEDIKRSEPDFRLYIQSCLYRELVDACGAHFYTVFFIRTTGHGDYWLVHLSQHPRARDVMTQVHWEKNNNFIHYGGPGIDMFRVLGYSAANDSAVTRQGVLGFCFDNPAAEASVVALMDQLPQLIYARPEGISFGTLFAETCNSSPADSEKYKEALARLVAQREIKILTADGTRRRLSNNTIRASDQLVPSLQGSFHF